MSALSLQGQGVGGGTRAPRASVSSSVTCNTCPPAPPASFHREPTMGHKGGPARTSELLFWSGPQSVVKLGNPGVLQEALRPVVREGIS